MGKPGARTKATDDTIKAIIDSFRKGYRRMETCDIAGICHETLMNWINADSEFSEAVKNAEYEGKLRRREKRLRSIEKAHEENGQWQAAAWLNEREEPELFAKRDPSENPNVHININVRYEDADQND